MNRNTGFTLVEILLALAILGTGLVGILSVFTVGTNTVRRTIALTEAGFIVQMVFEDFKRQGHTNPASLVVPEEDIAKHYSGYEVAPPVITPVENISGLYKVDLSIHKENNDEPLVQFTTYITKYEP